MKKVWAKLTKHFQGGIHTHYILVNETVADSKSEQETIMEYWGEHSDGGHNYGYRVDMHFMDEGELPPNEWLEKEKKHLTHRLEHLKDETKETKETIKLYEEILLKK